MINLDDQKKISRLDTGRVAESIRLLPAQMKQVLTDAPKISLPAKARRARFIVVNGMGGSNLGAHFLKSLCGPELKKPLLIEPGYEIPGFTGPDTLYILSSYSGTTEETVSVLPRLLEKKASLALITADHDSPLLAAGKKNHLPAYIFTPRANPSGQPRLGLGYAILGLWSILAKAGALDWPDARLRKIIDKLSAWDEKLRPNQTTAANPAKKIARVLRGRAPVLIGAEFLNGNLHIARNQINECAKEFSAYLSLPDLNHHALEGLSFPTGLKKDLCFLFFSSKLYHARVQRRLALTVQVAAKQGYGTLVHELQGRDRLEQGFELLQLGSWLSYYLGIINGVDPVKIPWVNWFKKQLSKK